MDSLNGFFDVRLAAVHLAGQPISWLELVSTLLYFASVVLAIRPHVLTWPIGISANFLLIPLYFQIQLYSDLLLQIYYIAVSLWAWRLWHGSTPRGSVEVGRLKLSQRTSTLLVALSSIAILGTFTSHAHELIPALVQRAAAFAYADASTTVLSVIATVLLARKRIENWVLWLLVNAVSAYLYAARGVSLMAAEYCLFFGMAAIGLFRWRRLLKASDRNGGVPQRA